MRTDQQKSLVEIIPLGINCKPIKRVGSFFQENHHPIGFRKLRMFGKRDSRMLPY